MDRYMAWTVMEARYVHGKFQSRRIDESLINQNRNDEMRERKKMKQELATDPGRVYSPTTSSVELSYYTPPGSPPRPFPASNNPSPYVSLGADQSISDSLFQNFSVSNVGYN